MEVHSHYKCHEEEPQSLGVMIQKPKHPQFAIITKREESFKTWPQHLPVSADELAESGFVYTGFDDSVRCYYCGGGLKKWEAGDDPWVEHITWYPDCPHVLLSKGQSFIDRVRAGEGSIEARDFESDGTLIVTESTHHTDGHMETLAAQSCLQMGYPEESVRRAIEKYIGLHGHSNFKGQDLCEILLDDEEEEASTVCEENGRLNSKNCKICLDALASIIFVSCGHIVTCPQCALAFSKCAICRQCVCGFVKAYFVNH